MKFLNSHGTATRVAVIGAGSVGALCAVRLAERGFDVTLVEKAAIGNGSSSRSAACIRAQFSNSQTVIGMMYSEQYFDEFHAHMHTRSDDRQNVITHNGYLFLYEDAKANPDYAEALAASWQVAQDAFAVQRAVGLDVHLLTPEQVRERWPYICTEHLIGATWCPRDGFLQSEVIYGEATRYAKEIGVKVLTWTEVIGSEVLDGKIVALETKCGSEVDRLEVDAVVNCTNAWAPRVSRTVGGMEISISPEKRYLYSLVPQPSFLVQFGEANWKHMPMTIYGMGGNRGVYTRPDNVRLMIGWAHPATPEPNFKDSDQDLIEPAFHHGNGIDNHGISALLQMSDFVPELAEGKIVATLSGYYATTPDHTPIIGQDTKLDNLVHAVGCSGHGLMHAPITAFLVEAILTDGVNQDGRVFLPAPFDQLAIDMHAFSPTRSFATDEKHVI